MQFTANYAGIWQENLRERTTWKIWLRWDDNSKMDLIGSIWLIIETSGRLL